VILLSLDRLKADGHRRSLSEPTSTECRLKSNAAAQIGIITYKGNKSLASIYSHLLNDTKVKETI
tara:strand:- start:689 stop:883 length:195 start_codon:yes stop_codon:yes gene_type:complete